jgi:hypothetical protein
VKSVSSDEEQTKESGEKNIHPIEVKSSPNEPQEIHFSESSKGVSLIPVGTDATNPFTQGPQPPSHVPQPGIPTMLQQAQPPAEPLPTAQQDQPPTAQQPKAQPTSPSEQGDGKSDK